MRVRVASFNVRTARAPDGRNAWWLRRHACLTAIDELGAAVVGLQEARPNQLAYLRARLARRRPGDALVGRGRDADGGGEHAAVLVRGGWRVEADETRWLSPTPQVPGSRGWDAELPRVATLVRLRHTDGQRLGILNTHFDHRGDVARERSAELVASWLAGETDRPWVLTGDLNAQPTSAPLRALADAGWSDTLPPDAGGTEHDFTGRTDRTRIDYVLTGPGVRCESAWIAHDQPRSFLRPRLPSDHWPVVADLIVD